MFFDGARTRARERRRRGQRRLEGRDGHARVRARRVDARPAARLRERAARDHRGARRATGGSTIRCCASASPTRGSGSRSCAYNALRSMTALERWRADPADDVVAQALLGDVPPRPRRARDRRARPGGDDRSTTLPYELTRAQRHVPLHAGPTRSTAARTRSSATSSASGPSACRPNRRWLGVTRATTRRSTRRAHGLLAGKIVLVTAAAGTGIGFATAERCAEEGATVVISDHHERRLGEAADQLARARRRASRSRWCATSPTRTQVQALVDAAVARARPHRRRGQQRRARRHREPRRHDRRAVDVVLDVTLNGTFRCTRAALRHMIAAGRGRHRQQRVGARLAGPGRPGALRRGEGRRDGAHPLRGDRGRAARRPGQRGRAEPRDAPVPRQGHDRRAARRARPTREAFGRAAEPWEVANVIVFLASDYSTYMTGEVVSRQQPAPLTPSSTGDPRRRSLARRRSRPARPSVRRTTSVARQRAWGVRRRCEASR